MISAVIPLVVIRFFTIAFADNNKLPDNSVTPLTLNDDNVPTDVILG